MNALVRFKTLKSKKTGQDFEALELTIGEYTTILFPTKIEKFYLKQYLKEKAQQDFKGEELKDVDSSEER